MTKFLIICIAFQLARVLHGLASSSNNTLSFYDFYVNNKEVQLVVWF